MQSMVPPSVAVYSMSNEELQDFRHYDHVFPMRQRHPYMVTFTLLSKANYTRDVRVTIDTSKSCNK